MRLHALRGATTAAGNDREAILAATEELMREVLRRNDLRPEDCVSCIFTVTEDLDAEFPALAARSIGFNTVPLLHAREIPVPGSLEKVIRVLVHYHAAEEHRAEHVYLHEARSLRRDLDGAQ
jgi:chorismate mutase